MARDAWFLAHWHLGMVGLLVAMEMKVEVVWMTKRFVGMVLTYLLLILEDTIQVQQFCYVKYHYLHPR